MSDADEVFIPTKPGAFARIQADIRALFDPASEFEEALMKVAPFPSGRDAARTIALEAAKMGLTPETFREWIVLGMKAHGLGVTARDLNMVARYKQRDLRERADKAKATRLS